MASEVGISRQALSQRMERLGILEEAAKERTRCSVSGPRWQATAGEQKTERQRILDAIDKTKNASEAAATLGIGRSTLYRKLRELSAR